MKTVIGAKLGQCLSFYLVRIASTVTAKVERLLLVARRCPTCQSQAHLLYWKDVQVCITHQIVLEMSGFPCGRSSDRHLLTEPIGDLPPDLGLDTPSTTGAAETPVEHCLMLLGPSGVLLWHPAAVEGHGFVFRFGR